MKSKQRKTEENMGLNLLKKGRRGLLRVVFSRAGLITIMLLIQIALMVAVHLYFTEFLTAVMGLSLGFSAIVALCLLNYNMDPSAKLTWLVVITLLPVFGSLLFVFTQSGLGHRLLRHGFIKMTEDTKNLIEQDAEVLLEYAEGAPDCVGLLHYLDRTGCHPVYDKTAVSYFPQGEEKFKSLLEELEKAEKFIFLEYFIIDEGLMWGKVLEILAKKALAGVDVRLIYDGACEFSTLPHNYPKLLKELGIKCKIFAPVTPFLSTHYNYRDHRKILVIDGHTAFTGGINMADEYINHIKRFGHWKDTAIMLKGEAARSFTLMFLQMWNMNEAKHDFSQLEAHADKVPEARGFVVPYADCPLDGERVGEWVYMDILNRSRRYVYIMTPYLILDGEMETALKFAAERGVDVRIILPGIPDKKLAYSLAKTHYRSLLSSGVKIFEYTPGFVHAKVFVCDDRESVVGTINLDYRSLYHHFECAAYMNGVDCTDEIKADFLKTQEQCRSVTFETIKKEKLSVKLTGFVMKVLAPLM